MPLGLGCVSSQQDRQTDVAGQGNVKQVKPLGLVVGWVWGGGGPSVGVSCSVCGGHSFSSLPHSLFQVLLQDFFHCLKCLFHTNI